MNCNKCGGFFSEGQTKCPQCGEEVNYIGVVPAKKMINLLGIVAAIITAVGVFLPAITIEMWGLSESVALFEGYGKFIFGVAIAFGILVFLKKEKSAQGIALLSSVLMIYQYFNETQGLKEYTEYGITAGLSIGFYLCLFGSIVMSISPFIWNKLQRKK